MIIAYADNGQYTVQGNPPSVNVLITSQDDTRYFFAPVERTECDLRRDIGMFFESVVVCLAQGFGLIADLCVYIGRAARFSGIGRLVEQTRVWRIDTGGKSH